MGNDLLRSGFVTEEELWGKFFEKMMYSRATETFFCWDI